ncbi:MAG: alanine--tRNA ligase [Candidatus Omnitrophica bacterium]|nr:alanine--tRNA ligase [Candidatus Omnitrophota bacterium]
MRTDDIRQSFLEFFKSKGHTFVPSDSLVPKDDPTLLFTGAGMNQFKEKFLGRNITYKRATSSQKCLRTGDLDNVGRTSGHHTFFEMLGNFSFGDYFKKEAIQWAWEYFTKVLKIDSERLWASVYKDDEEAYEIWKNVIKLPENRIMKFGEKDNFWPSEAPTKGPNGPCGPCSEIFYDYGKNVGCGRPGCTPACDCGRFVEVWNMVFTQFDRQKDGALKPLPNKNIDTGMGLERLASVMQGVKTNFEIDIFVPIAEVIASHAEGGTKQSKIGITSSAEKRSQPPRNDARSRISAIADHIRAVTFCVADGVMPSNEERGYVVRKLIRRSMSHAREIGIKEVFLYKLIGVITDMMGEAYPDLKEKRDDIAQVVKREEENFITVIHTQLPKVEEVFSRAHSTGTTGKDLAAAAFDFYDTYGMPYEMLEEIAEKFSLKIDKAAFDGFLEEQRQKSRAGTKIKGEIFTETFAKKVEALGLKTEFLGYENSHAEAKVVAVLDGGEVILDRTPFYGESGGQAGDWGRIETPSGAMEVEDAKKIGATIVHIGRMLRGKLVNGETAKATIDEDIRMKVAANHTATHLLQAALRKVLGEHVHQTGSLVDSEHLRFDFTHMKKMDEREVSRVEEMVNGFIKDAVPVGKTIESLEEARSEGAMALFGEKYEKTVRVVTIKGVSKELCGGTHADNTKDIGIFRITSESSIASGVRRIEALTGAAAVEWIAKQEEAKELKLKAQKEKDEGRKRMGAVLQENAARIDSFLAGAKTVGQIKIIAETIDGINIEGLRSLSDRIKSKEASSVIILAAKDSARVSFIVAVGEALAGKSLSAGDLAKEFAAMIDGSGGGKPLFAQGGGKAPEKLSGALKAITEVIAKRLK